MSNDKVFVDGLFFNLPRENSPEFVRGNLNIDMKKFIEWSKAHHKDGKVSIDLLIARSGKPYAALNTYEPKEKEEAMLYDPYKAKQPAKESGLDDFEDSDLPF